MAKSASIIVGGTNSHSTAAADFNRISTDFIADGVVGAITNTSGVAPTTGGYAVNATGTPSNQTVVTAGRAYITSTPTGSTSQSILFSDDAGTTITHAANASGSTKYDWIYVAPSATALATPATDASDTFTYTVSRSSSNVTDNGTPPTFGHNIAVVTLVNNFVTITNANIADKRVRTGAAANSLIPNVTLPATTVVPMNLASNPYKFYVYRAAALTYTNQTVMPFDTKIFDTSSNVDVVTNKGRFTAPIAGFYHFDATLSFQTAGASVAYAAQLYKNGIRILQGKVSVNMYNGGYQEASQVSGMLQLVAGDYIEVGGQSAGTISTLTGASETWFQGFLVSAT